MLTAASGFCYAWAAACNAGAQAGLTRAYGGSDGDALRAGAIAYVSTSAFQAAGSLGGGSYWAHAAAGCVSAAAGGGNCGRGAVLAVFGKFATIELGISGSGLQYDVANGAIAITAGGIGSVIAGGKFENGAVTAAYGYLFNQLSQAGRAAAGAGSSGGQGGVTVQAQNALAVKVDQFFSDVGDQLSYIFKSDSIVLARNMAQDAGMSRDAGQHAHHIVAAGDARAEPARLILTSAGMDINSAFNGIFLDPSQHARIHTNVYYNSVNTFLSGSSGYADVATRLTGMRLLINAGKFPF